MKTTPLFPLPEVVLLPEEILPLHIFEPRYLAMTQDVLSGSRSLAMALLKPGWQKGYFESPAIYEVCGLGQVVSEEKLSDGRFNLLLKGCSRIRLGQCLKEEPYRVASFEVIEDHYPCGRETELVNFRMRLIEQAERRVPSPANAAAAQAGLPAVGRSVLKAPDLHSIPLGRLTDLLAGFLSLPYQEKQALLEEVDVLRRAKIVSFLLSVDILHDQNPLPSPRPPQ